MAEELFEVLRPHLEGPHLHVAGHSLGGSLATLVGLTAHLRGVGAGPAASAGGSGSSSNGGSSSRASGSSGASSSSSSSSSGGGGGSGGSSSSAAQQRPQQPGQPRVQVTTFGSPPVLALASAADEDGRAILRALRLPLGTVRNYVLQVRGVDCGSGLREETRAPPLRRGATAQGCARAAPPPRRKPTALLPCPNNSHTSRMIQCRARCSPPTLPSWR